MDTRSSPLYQKLGFAEADPTADVEGHDARNKLVLLSRLAFGTTLAAPSVATQGISGVAAADLALAASLGYAVRLIGRAEAAASGHVHSFVGPALVPLTVREGPRRVYAQARRSPLGCCATPLQGIVSRALGGNNAVQVSSSLRWEGRGGGGTTPCM